MEADFYVLPLEQVRVVKEIHFDYQFGRTRSTAKVIYLRTLSETYQMRSENGKSICPDDDLDKLILDALTKKYDNVIVTDWLLMCSSQLKMINNVRKAALEVVILNVREDMSSLTFFDPISNKKIEMVRFPLEVYVNNHATRQYFTGDVCDLYIPLEEWKNLADRIKHLKNTYTTLSKYLEQF